jgi:glyceraldehyde 3-phosphate dehydrogenase
MPIKVAINGYGRIGRNILKALYESQRFNEIQIVAINELNNIQSCAHLTQWDTAHGRFNFAVTTEDNHLVINNDKIAFFSCTNPEDLPWKQLEVDVVLECTGLFKSRQLAGKHLKAGAKKVLISAPSDGEVDATVVYGVNDKIIKPEDKIISNASCTTNCLSPVVKPIHETIGIEHGLITCIHAYTNDQALSDTFHNDLRRARAAPMSQIPTSTGAAKAVGLVLPDLNGKLDGFAVRVPTINVSLVDLVLQASRPTTVDEINKIMQQATKKMKGIIAYNSQSLVSIDFNHNPHSAIFDASLTKVMGGTLIKVLAWYDNEWGFSNRMLDVSLLLMRV